MAVTLEEIRTFKDIQDTIIDWGKLKDDATTRKYVRRLINLTYLEVCFEEDYRWSGFTRSLRLEEQYTTGTLTLTQGSQTITGVGTAWAELSHLHWYMKIGSQSHAYKVKRVASATSITLDTPYIGESGSSVAYTLFKRDYGLFPDCQNVRKISIPGATRRVYSESPEQIDEYIHSKPFAGGVPRYWTINGQSYYRNTTWATFLIDTDFWEDDITNGKPKNKNLILYPSIFTTDRMAEVRYTKTPYPLVSDAEEPWVPYENRIVLVLKPLLLYFLKNQDIQTQREWQKLYKTTKRKMASDIEPGQDEFITIPDRRFNRRYSQLGALDSEDLDT